MRGNAVREDSKEIDYPNKLLPVIYYLLTTNIIKGSFGYV